MGISDMIAGFIQEVLEDENGCCELQRSQLANRFCCAPSQINYVISTRFSPEHGYVVESRRGGNGYIRIRRVHIDPRCLIMHTVNIIGDSIDRKTAEALLCNLTDSGAFGPDAARLMTGAISDSALSGLPREQRDIARAGILKQMLVEIISLTP